MDGWIDGEGRIERGMDGGMDEWTDGQSGKKVRNKGIYSHLLLFA